MKYLQMSLTTLAVASALTACNSGNNTHTNSVSFTQLSLPASTTQKAEIRTSGNNFKELFRTGDVDTNGEVWGQMKNVHGDPIPGYICDGLNSTQVGSGTDFSAILKHNNKIYLMSQFECETGGMYMSELSQDSAGNLTPVAGTLRSIDQSKNFGGWVHCAGSVTPWNSVLGGEEYEPNAADPNLEADQYWADYKNNYWGGSNKANPYMVGYITETTLDDAGNPTYHKHFGMGRFSHELGYVMPDQKTVYMTDDGDNDTLFMFVADTAGNLSAGTLYAAVWNQTSGANGGAADLSWINLGHATDADIKTAIKGGIQFSDLFTTGDVDACDTAAGYSLVAPGGIKQCIKVKGGKAMLASRLEARRYAAIKGATHEFRKMEGFTYNGQGNVGYVAISEAGRGMLNNIDDPDKGKNYDYDGATGNHIKLDDANYCGGVYSLAMQASIKDTSGKVIPSNYVAANMDAMVMGGSATDPDKNNDDAEACATNTLGNFAQPDNLSFLAHSSTLLIGEDGDHENNMLWAYDVSAKTVTRVATVPTGAETTSPYWHLDINGYSYISLVAQHASGWENGPHTVTGYVGPHKNLTK